ncbi:hypothetical protein [Ralstonia sp. ASV6]|uniref:hypothetical protein n=1 Tax=Ralstonia sp. ASV6 TaxID=2795124 RepID=UPI0018ED7EB9|nr:hypothetical protein [Ralstonia sp. ASV6]
MTQKPRIPVWLIAATAFTTLIGLNLSADYVLSSFPSLEAVCTQNCAMVGNRGVMENVHAREQRGPQVCRWR